MKKAFYAATVLCYVLAAVAVMLGVSATVELIRLYGEAVSPIALAAQAAVFWVPLATVLLVAGRLFRRNS